MRLFRADALDLPAKDEGWSAAAIGFTLAEARILGYVSIALFFIVNGLGFLLFGLSYLDGFTHLVSRHPTLIAAAALAGIAAYYVLHELLHALFHPDRGLSARTMVGMKAAAVFVVYNGRISRRKLQWLVLAPLLLLTPLCVALLAGAWTDPQTFTPVVVFNLLGLHLSACAGDVLLSWKLWRHPPFAWMWNGVSSVWVK